MLNNEFRFIGTVITDYEKGGSENFPKHFFTIEVERRKKTTPCTFRVTVHEKNLGVDVTKSAKGKQVILTGYIDQWKDRIELIAQDMIVVGAVPHEKEELKEPNLDAAIDLPDNDLPFL